MQQKSFPVHWGMLSAKLCEIFILNITLKFSETRDLNSLKKKNLQTASLPKSKGCAGGSNEMPVKRQGIPHLM